MQHHFEELKKWNMRSPLNNIKKAWSRENSWGSVAMVVTPLLSHHWVRAETVAVLT
jgi:rhamnogalacturonyl hydrolase YesR